MQNTVLSVNAFMKMDDTDTVEKLGVTNNFDTGPVHLFLLIAELLFIFTLTHDSPNLKG